jgi:hypothetical protein
MELKIRVKTPVGQAKVTSERVDMRLLLLARTKAKLKESYVNKENSEFIWVLDVPPRNYSKVLRNISMYTVGVHATLSKVAGSKLVRKHMEEGWESKLDDMFKQTKIEVLKEATPDELAEINEGYKSFFERVKEKWNKYIPNKNNVDTKKTE